MTSMATLAEFAHDPRKHIELVDGEIIVSPNAAPRHFYAMARLMDVLEAHGLYACGEGNMILNDADPLHPLVREPDVYVLREASEEEDGGLFQRAEDALLVVEIVSPGSGATDWIDKMIEYADAGIPHYWIIEFGADGTPHLYTLRNIGGAYGHREHWIGPVDTKIAGTVVRFDTGDLVRRRTHGDAVPAES
ncbi:MAG TPA: Uma2 family endonuclease [Actinocrinis sp.]